MEMTSGCSAGEPNGDSRVVRDQGGFRNSIHPARGKALDY